MAGEWRDQPLSNLCSYINRGSAPAYVQSGGILVLNQKCVRDQRVSFAEARRTDTLQKPVNPERMLQPFDILVNSTGVGTLGRVAQVSSLPEPATVDSHVTLVRPDPASVHPRYLGYAVRSFEPEIEALGEGSTGQTELARGRLADFTVPVPPVGEQAAIARILGTLDDKIELNRRMSETLEVMARALFKSWFVDFDPVRAKLEGRWCRGESLPGLPAHFYDLFPDRLVDSELGEIPEGWEIKAIGDLAEVVGGSTPKTARPEYWEGGMHHWVTPKDLSGLSMPVLLDTERKITDAGLAQISSGLLPQGTVLLSSRAPIGYLAVAEVSVAVNQGFIAMKPRPGISNLFLLRWVSAAHDEIISYANGSTFLEISKVNFRPIRTVAPIASVMQAFDRVARPRYRQVVENERESRTLAALRDALLPKLISGELRVKDAEKFIGGTLT